MLLLLLRIQPRYPPDEMDFTQTNFAPNVAVQRRASDGRFQPHLGAASVQEQLRRRDELDAFARRSERPTSAGGGDDDDDSIDGDADGGRGEGREEGRRSTGEGRASAVHVPYRSNRCVVFSSRLLHATQPIRFGEGYRRRRVNLTFLFGA